MHRSTLPFSASTRITRVKKASSAAPPEPAGTLFEAAERKSAGRPSLGTRINDGCAAGRLHRRALERMQAFTRLIRTMRDEAAGAGISDAVEAALRRTGYLKTLQDENTSEAEDRIDNLMELVATADDYQ